MVQSTSEKPTDTLAIHIYKGDADNATLSTATVTITGGFVTGQDVLSFTNAGATTMGNIAGTYNATDAGYTARALN